MKDYLQPLQSALKRNDQRNMIFVKRKLIKWKHIIYQMKKNNPLSKINNQSFSNSLPIPINEINKTKTNQSNSSFRSTKVNGSSYPSSSPFQCNYDCDCGYNTSKNTIMRIMNVNRINNTNDYCSTHSQFDTQFLQRQKTFLITKEKTKERVKQGIEEGAKIECTFSPKINNKKKMRRNKSAFNRLYADNFERKQKQNMKELQLIQLIKTEANNYNNKTQYDPKRIDDLYEEYKIKEKKQKELFEEINNKRGFPFAPIINKQKKNKNTNLSFDETLNTRTQDKENLKYVLEYIKYKEEKEIN